MSDPIYRGRLAPSPTGALHLGNARTFLVAWLRARQAGGTILMRMEDLDGPRVKAGAAAAVLEDLRWLGFDWDEGPDVGGPSGPYTQTERRERYASALERLVESRRVYACTCTRREVEEASSAPHESMVAPPAATDGARYPGTCRGRHASAAAATAATGRIPAWRFAVEAGTLGFTDAFAGEQRFDVGTLSGDFVVARAAGEAAYQLAVVVDDIDMGITEVVRGDDLLPSTARQIMLYRALGAGARVPGFLHVPLAVGTDGRRLAKRHGDTTIARYRRAGVTAERIVGLLAAGLGIGAIEEARPRDLVARFALDRVPRGPIVLEATVLDRGTRERP